MIPQLFRRLSTRKQEDKDDMTRAFKTLIDARFDRLEANFKSLNTEWSDVYDKMMLLYDRTRKRIKAAEKAAGEDMPVAAIQTPIASREDVLRAYLSQNGGQ